MRTHEETHAETARELEDDASESRRWVLDKDEPEPLGLWFHMAVGLVVVVLLVILARVG
jgi:hypothetical protein